jgi:predicted transcriptional regulator
MTRRPKTTIALARCDGPGRVYIQLMHTSATVNRDTAKKFLRELKAAIKAAKESDL